jgi:hypothetical protein
MMLALPEVQSQGTAMTLGAFFHRRQRRAGGVGLGHTEGRQKEVWRPASMHTDVGNVI